MKYETAKLPNGVRVVAAPLAGRKSAALGIWVHAGGRDESEKLNGVAHFLEHLVFKGTSRRTAKEIKEAIEGVGGSLNAFTSEEYTCFLSKTSERHLDQAFDVLSDMTLNALLEPKDIEKERAVIMEEIKMTQDLPSELVEEVFSELIWPGHALGRPLAGTLQSVGALKREGIQNFKSEFYNSHFITVAASGAVSLERLLALADRAFSKTGRAPKKRLDSFKSGRSGRRLKVLSKKTEQTHLVLGVHAQAKEHPDQYALDLLSVILGGNMSSRLFNEVREEKGLAYDIGSTVRRYHDTGAFMVSAGVDNRKPEEALRTILSELKKITREPPPKDELRRAKEFYTGQMELGLESAMSHMLWVGESMVCLGRCKTPGEVLERVAKITSGDIRRVARGIFKSDRCYLAAVGPRVDKMQKNFSKLLSDLP
ncbi:MAG: hypothetical protein A3C47_04165 [Omnitrophica bacterium RIFCSPHIGHO2_02_FULL_51_18]|nr:MAG: hypothetical protein A3C47_04165 [Omnitrophica bacterium RIFCSPHIGHO2_02_FULL_51_18]